MKHAFKKKVGKIYCYSFKCDFSFSDVDTRRRSACDLVQALSKSFEGPVIQNFSQYVQGLLQVNVPLFLGKRSELSPLVKIAERDN
jgi:hypothetical protein